MLFGSLAILQRFPNRIFSPSTLIAVKQRMSSSITKASSPISYQQSYLSQSQAQELDQKLFLSWDVSVLMELAGLSVACAVQDAFDTLQSPKVLVLAGPGNNGGDGLVAARHLHHFGFQPTIIYPKVGKSSLFTNLVKQCEELGIPFVDSPTDTDANNSQSYDIILDSIFGFSFNPSRGVRAPFDTMIEYMSSTDVPIVSVDVPSGWDVETGDSHNIGVVPSILVSLTAPKLFAKTKLPIGTTHYLGGRFLSPKLAAEYGLEGVMDLYTGSRQFIQLAALEEGDCTINSNEGKQKL